MLLNQKQIKELKEMEKEYINALKENNVDLIEAPEMDSDEEYAKIEIDSIQKSELETFCEEYNIKIGDLLRYLNDNDYKFDLIAMFWDEWDQEFNKH